MTGVIYARYSSDNQREESIEGQLRECKEFAERQGITILGTYIDRALSAKTDHRPDFQRMIKDSAKGLFDVVIVWKLDRFARNRYDSAHYKAILRKNGVKVVSAKEVIAEDSTGILLESLLEGYAEFYSAELSEKVIRGLTENALKCKYNGGGLPVGYAVDRDQFFQLDPVTAPVVLESFTLYANGATIKQVADILNSKGIRTNRGQPMSINSVTRMLKNRRYIGEYAYRDIVQENGVPPIVPVELFERVQERMQKNRKAPARFKAEDKYLLTTKLYCGKCGAYMTGEAGTSHTMRVHHYYKCFHTRKPKTCDKKNVQKVWIEDLVIDQTMKMVFDNALMETLADMLIEVQGRENTILPVLKKRLAETETALDNMLNAIQAGIFTTSTKKRLDELEAAKSELEVQILQEEMQKPVFTRDQILFSLHRFRELDMAKQEHRQRLVDTFINAIYLYDDKIVLTFNYKDGAKTITLADIQGSGLESRVAPKVRNPNPMGSDFFYCPRRRKSAPWPRILFHRRDLGAPRKRLDQVLPGDRLPQRIKAAAAAEAIVEHHHVSPGRVVGQRAFPGVRQGRFRRVQLVRRVKDLLVGAEVLDLRRQGELCIERFRRPAVVEFKQHRVPACRYAYPHRFRLLCPVGFLFPRRGASRAFEREGHRHAAAAECVRKARRVLDPPERRIAVRGGETLIEQHQAVGAVQHQISRADLGGDPGIGGEAVVEIAVFFVSVHFAHFERQRQAFRQRPRGPAVVEPRQKGLPADRDPQGAPVRLRRWGSGVLLRQIRSRGSGRGRLRVGRWIGKAFPGRLPRVPAAGREIQGEQQGQNQ